MIVKVLGAIDLIAGFTFLIMIFGFEPFLPLILFSAGLLFMKGLFALTGDILSFLDLLSSFTLILSIFLGLPMFWLWTLAFLLFAKAMVSFV